MSDLAFMAKGSLSRLSHVVSRLEQRGYVSRRPSPDDGRTTLATAKPERASVDTLFRRHAGIRLVDDLRQGSVKVQKHRRTPRLGE
mgnify:CR=1 FL=1